MGDIVSTRNLGIFYWKGVGKRIYFYFLFLYLFFIFIFYLFKKRGRKGFEKSKTLFDVGYRTRRQIINELLQRNKTRRKRKKKEIEIKN